MPTPAASGISQLPFSSSSTFAASQNSTTRAVRYSFGVPVSCGSMNVRPHDRFSKTVRLSEAEIAFFAAASGDSNPIHHDPEYAAGTRYRGIVASGPQTTALLLGLTAAHFSKIGAMVGLEFTTIFKAGVPADDDLTLEWLVIRVEPKRGGSLLVELRGRLRTSAGVTAVGAKGKILVTPTAH